MPPDAPADLRAAAERWPQLSPLGARRAGAGAAAAGVDVRRDPRAGPRAQGHAGRLVSRRRAHRRTGRGHPGTVRVASWRATRHAAHCWGEGDKTSRFLALANTDPTALQLFIRWTRQFHGDGSEFVLSLHLHHGNDERLAREWWAEKLRVDAPEFTKTFIKPPGTGHRKNRLRHGVCRVRVRRSTDAWHRTMTWIAVVGERVAEDDRRPE